MAVNLIGQPSETTGAAHAVSSVLLALHVVVAIGLLAGAVMVIRAARGGGERPRQLARSGAVLIGLTVIAGVMTVITKNNWWGCAITGRLHRLHAAVREPAGAGAEPGAAARATELIQIRSPRWASRACPASPIPG